MENLESVSWLCYLAELCRDYEKLAIIIANPKSRHFVITNSAVRLFEGVVPRIQTAELILGLLRETIRNHDEHGHLAMIFCAQLIIWSRSEIRIFRPVRLICIVIDIVHSWLDEYLSRRLCACAFSVQLNDCTSLMALVRPIMASSSLLRLSPSELHRLSLLIVSAFRYSVARSECEFALLPPIIISVVGPSPKRSVLVEGLLLDLPFPPHPSDLALLPSSGPIAIALFEAELDPRHHNALSQRDAAAMAALNQAESAAFVAKAVPRGWRMVVSQRDIWPPLQAALRAAGIVAVERVPASHMAAIRRLAAAAAEVAQRPVPRVWDMP